MKDKKFDNLMRQAFASHLSFCSKGRRLLTTVVKLENIEKAESNSAVKEKIGAAAESPKISLAWIQGHLKLKETNAESLPFWNVLQPALVRGDSRQQAGLQQAFPTIPPFSKTLREYKVVVQVGEEERGKCEVRCRISPLAKKGPGSGIRVDLLQAERTLSSYPPDNDTALFNGIEPFWPFLQPGNKGFYPWEESSFISPALSKALRKGKIILSSTLKIEGEYLSKKTSWLNIGSAR